MAQIKVSDIRIEKTPAELFNLPDKIVTKQSAKGKDYEAHVIEKMKVVISGEMTEITSQDGKVFYAYEVYDPKSKFNFKVKAPNKIDSEFGVSVGLVGLVGGIAGNFVWFKADKIVEIKTA
ncbi:hypothetical protein FE415_09365 [Leuconostoc carnosum]|uniref:hypothetical protein n=2 Tax=Leuconostoc TaxID=1243 RepID=UPI001238475B|nr:hypothetical protein [Leuconostoc carnosum]KAA8369971.1 hypothetical protein FE415_09365 [Leuconostoc carnosum]